VAKQRTNTLPEHDAYFTIGEGIASRTALVPDCGIEWLFTPLPVHLPSWPVTLSQLPAPFTTVSNWWGEEGKEWILNDGVYESNNKRTSFLEYLELPMRTRARLELSLTLTDAPIDIQERSMLERNGWAVRPFIGTTWTVEDFRCYVQASRGEFSCLRPFFVRLEAGLLADRSLYYLASGKPAIVQWTGPSAFLPDSAGLFRFRNIGEAIRALDSVESDYETHCRLARSIAEEHFDGMKVARNVLSRALP
jgi:hypothetical protein